MSQWQMSSEFFPAPVSEAEWDKHPWGGSECGYTGKERKGCSTFPPASIFLILIPPLPCVVLSDQ